MSESTQFIYVIRPTRLEMLTAGPSRAEQKVLEQHVEHLSKLAQEGVLLLAGRTQTADEKTFGIVILKAASPDEAQQLMASDPVVRQGVMSAELYPYKLAVVAKNLEFAA